MVETKVIEHVIAGNVLDEYGHWVSIEEKVRTERQFLEHLERGEILTNRIWKKMDCVEDVSQSGEEDIPVTVPVPQSEKGFRDPEATVAFSLEAPEETIDMSVETVAAYMGETQPDVVDTPETDFPPETAELLIEPAGNTAHREDQERHRFEIDGKTQMDIPVDALNDDETKGVDAVTEKTEFEETVFVNIKQLQKQIEEEKKRRKSH